MLFSIDNFLESFKAGMIYIPVTLKMAVVIFVWATLIGGIIGTIRFYKVPVLAKLLNGFVTLYLGVPMVLAINIYYLMYITFYSSIASFFNIQANLRDANYLVVAYFTMIIGISCGISEKFIGGYKSIANTQFEAGATIGLTRFQTLKRIILPQVAPVILPSMLNTFTATVKNMSIVSIIGVYEIMNASLLPSFKNYSYVEGYLAAALLYWFLVIIIEILGYFIEEKTKQYIMY